MNFKKINTKKVKKIAYWLILGFLLAVLVFVLIPILPIQNNYSLKMVLSGSMEPAIKTGGVVMVKPASNYEVGDIVTYQYGRKARNLTTHRIIGQKDNEFITKGDNNNAADINPIKKEQILGKVVLAIPYAGYIANFARSKIGLFLLIFIPALLIIRDEGLKIIKEIKKIRQKKNNDSSKIKKAVLKISILLILVSGLFSFGFIDSVNSYFSALIVSENNYFQAGAWMPVLNLIGNKTVQSGLLLEFTISATDPNNDLLSYSASNLPGTATFTDKTFSWTPIHEQVGIYPNVHFEVFDGKYTDSENITITVTEMPFPEITNIQAINITTSSADITWQTDQAATSKVEYGETDSYGSVLENLDFVETHSISIPNLTPSTLYHYQVSSKNTADKETISNDYQFPPSE